ncbi:hypothetical protein ACLKA7_012132 [Drosophila subpalustris]
MQYISEVFTKLGHDVKSVVNITNKEKKPLDLFAVEILRKSNNKELFLIKKIGFVIVTIELPKSHHLSSTCAKPNTLPACCANCGLDHTSNFAGCRYYKLAISPEKKNDSPAVSSLAYQDTEINVASTHPLQQKASPSVVPKVPSRKQPAHQHLAQFQNKLKHQRDSAGATMSFAAVLRRDTAEPPAAIPRSDPAVLSPSLNSCENSDVQHCLEAVRSGFASIESRFSIQLQDILRFRQYGPELNSLKIGIWNADGLSHHKLELVQFLIKENIDIMLITNHPSDVGRGDAAIIIRSNLIHHPLSFTSQANAQAVTISLGNNSELTIAAIYLKPGGRQDTIDDAQLLDIFLGLGPRFIIGGDFNARHGFWGCQKSCKRGRAIANLSQSQNWNILATGAPTYFPYGRRGSPSNLDFAIYKGIPDRNLFMESRLDLSSDHLPLIALLQHDVVYLRNRVSLLPKKTNMLIFQRKLERILDADRSFQSPGDIDDGIDHLNQCIEVISADFQNRDPVSINPLSRIFPLSGEALALLEEKRRLRRRWLRNGNFEDNRAWKLLSRRLRSVLTEDKRRHFETLLEGMDPRKPSDFNVWNLTKGIKRQAPSNFAIQTDQGWSKSDSEKASIFGQSFKISRLASEPVDVPDHFSFSLEEVSSEIKLIKPRKSPGIDGYLQPAHLKLSTRRHFRSINIHQIHFGDPDIGNPCCQLGDTRITSRTRSFLEVVNKATFRGYLQPAETIRKRLYCAHLKSSTRRHIRIIRIHQLVNQSIGTPLNLSTRRHNFYVC